MREVRVKPRINRRVIDVEPRVVASSAVIVQRKNLPVVSLVMRGPLQSRISSSPRQRALRLMGER
jgi:hypothetical protein